MTPQYVDGIYVAPSMWHYLRMEVAWLGEIIERYGCCPYLSFLDKELFNKTLTDDLRDTYAPGQREGFPRRQYDACCTASEPWLGLFSNDPHMSELDKREMRCGIRESYRRMPCVSTKAKEMAQLEEAMAKASDIRALVSKGGSQAEVALAGKLAESEKEMREGESKLIHVKNGTGHHLGLDVYDTHLKKFVIDNRANYVGLIFYPPEQLTYPTVPCTSIATGVP